MMKTLVLLLLTGYIAHAQVDSLALVLVPRIERLTVQDWGFRESELHSAYSFIPFDVQDPRDSCSKCLRLIEGVSLKARGSWGDMEGPLSIFASVDGVVVAVFYQEDAPSRGTCPEVVWDTLHEASLRAKQKYWARQKEQETEVNRARIELLQSTLRRFK